MNVRIVVGDQVTLADTLRLEGDEESGRIVCSAGGGPEQAIPFAGKPVLALERNDGTLLVSAVPLDGEVTQP